ncbi:MAG: DNA polymerase III subunit delta' [Candidatus Aminicenantes bacterium RBG_13_63_10]|nr:MAG: DNA polymerase III subunit delta' [Candidatus Aminicenantes bacterium RBG_13_63_10]
MAFKDVAGNVRIKRILKLALERTRVPNSLLFCGPEGVGKKAMALTLAKTLNCLNLTTDSCDACPSCKAIDKGVHPDVMVIAAEKQEIKIEQTRFLKQMAYLRPMTGKKRVFIVADASGMSDAAANSLLKVLEEPPLHSHLILVTASPFLLFPTILSRCQTLAFSAIGREELEEILLERNFGPEQARILSLLVGGNLERAMDLEWEEVQSLKEESWALFEALVSGDRSALFLERFGALAKAVQEEFGQTLELFSSFVRDILLLRLGGDPQFLLNPDFEPRLREVAAAWTVRRVLGVLEELDFVLTELPKNLNKGLLATTFFSNFGELRHV